MCVRGEGACEAAVVVLEGASSASSGVSMKSFGCPWVKFCCFVVSCGDLYRSCRCTFGLKAENFPRRTFFPLSLIL